MTTQLPNATPDRLAVQRLTVSRPTAASALPGRRAGPLAGSRRRHHPGDGDRAARAFQGFGQWAADANGAFRFRTIRPAACPARARCSRHSCTSPERTGLRAHFPIVVAA